jgi:hypothetical protein
VTDTVSGKRFLTSSTADDPAQCHEVPLMLDFLPNGPAGALQVIPLTPNTLEMEIHFVDLSNATSPALTVPGDLATQHGGVDYVLIKPAATGGGPVPVALTAMKLG